jgi:PAS domain S-box-containing protein
MKTGQTQVFKRYIDLPAFVVPIGIDGKTYGFLIGGLVRLGNPNMELCSQEARRLRVDLDRFLTMYLELSFVSNERFEACANLLKIVASALSNLSKEGTETKAKLEDMETLNGMLEKEIEQASVELKLTEDRYRNLFFTVQDGVYITDLTGRVKDINPAGAKMLGYERGEFIGKFMRDVYMNPQDRDEFVKMILKHERVYNFNPYVRLKNGQPKFFETNASVIKDQQGKIIGIQGIFRDISGRNHQNLSLINNQASNVPQPANQQSTPNNQSAS